MKNCKMKDYIEPRMDVIALEYQNLIASSIDPSCLSVRNKNFKI